MKPLSIFWRLVLGYGVILGLSICGYAYFIIELGSLSATARAVSDTDNRMIGYQERLTDSLLSEVQYGAKFTISQAQGHYNQAAEFQKEFTRYLGELKTIAPSPSIKAQVALLEQLHITYTDLFDQEVGYIRANQAYAQSRYQEARDKISSGLLQELERLKNELQDRLHAQLVNLDGVARTAQRTAVASLLVLLGLSLVLSIKFSARLAAPLKELRRRTEDHFTDGGASNVSFSAIPEMQELFDALKREKTRLRKDGATKASLIEKSTEELSAGLISLKRQFIDFQRNSNAAGGNRTESSGETILNEVDTLLRYCAELNALSSAPREVRAPCPGTREDGAETCKTLPANFASLCKSTVDRIPGFLDNLRDSLALHIARMKKSSHGRKDL